MPYDSRYPPEHTTYNTTAPLHSITAEDYVPDQQAVNYPHLRSLRSLRSGGLLLSGSANDFYLSG